MHISQIIDQDPGSVHLFYRDLRDVLLDFSSCLLGAGPAALILRQPCLGRVAPPPVWGGWGWAQYELEIPGFCSLVAFPGGFLCLF